MHSNAMHVALHLFDWCKQSGLSLPDSAHSRFKLAVFCVVGGRPNVVQIEYLNLKHECGCI